jgi:hypothetical protein
LLKPTNFVEGQDASLPVDHSAKLSWVVTFIAELGAK